MAETSETPFIRCRFANVSEIRDPDDKKVYYPDRTGTFELPDHAYLHYLRQRALARKSVRKGLQA